MTTPKNDRKVNPQPTANPPRYPVSHARLSGGTSRRQFLLRLTAGGGAVAFATGVPLVKAQELDVDFTILDEHDPLVSDSVDLVRRRGRAQDDVGDGTGSMGLDDGSETGTEESDDNPTIRTDITENRALWIPPGYLLLLQWTRPEEETSPVETLEGLTDMLTTHLAEAVSDTDVLHDAVSLQEIEVSLMVLLNEQVTPAVISVVHLDHDCEALCPADPPTTHAIRGRMVSPE